MASGVARGATAVRLSLKPSNFTCQWLVIAKFVYTNSRVYFAALTPKMDNGKLIVDLIVKVNGTDGQVDGACRVCVHEITRVMRTVDASNGKLSVDCTAKVDGEDGKVAGALKVCVHEKSPVVRTVDTSNEGMGNSRSA